MVLAAAKVQSSRYGKGHWFVRVVSKDGLVIKKADKANLSILDSGYLILEEPLRSKAMSLIWRWV
jgi:hypothetical protein